MSTPVTEEASPIERLDVPMGDGRGHLIRARAGNIVYALCGFTFQAVLFGADEVLTEDRRICNTCFRAIL